MDHYNYSINMPERGSVMSVDGKIGYTAVDDHLLAITALYDSSDIEVLSEDGDIITFRCAGTQHIGNKNGTVTVYGTPWDGKHHLSRKYSCLGHAPQEFTQPSPICRCWICTCVSGRSIRSPE